MTPTHLAERYRIAEQIGIGGMGTVFAAEDERLGRRVAVKVLKEELSSDPRFVERFRREARAAASLSHPNVASVFDYGEEGGRHFIVMELIEGRDLARVMREEGPFEAERSLSYTEQIARALGHAHSAGLIHRDVKPHNIIVCDDGRIKVTDFGIARATGESTLTATGTIMGTAQYVSPEQSSGETPGPQSDVYSLGIVLFEMLTGAVPFTGDSPISVALRHVRETVPAPSSIDPSLPVEVDELVARATAKQPDDRFADGNAFAAALAGDPEPVATAPLVAAETTTWPFEQEPRWDPARLGKIVLITFAFLFALAVGALAYRLATNEEPQRRQRAAGDRRAERTETPAPASFPLEDYRAQPAEEAMEQLSAVGLLGNEQPTECDQPEGYVCEQDPGPGETVTEGDAVTLLVNASGDEDDKDDEESQGEEDAGVGKNDKVPPGQEKKDKDD